MQILIEYKGVPAIIDHEFKKIDKIVYVVVYKTGEYNYLRKDFETIDSAIEYEPKNELKLIFIQLISIKDQKSYFSYRNIKFVNNRLEISKTVEEKYRGFEITIGYLYVLGLKVKKSEITSNNTVFEFRLHRRTNPTTYYEFIPHFKDIFLEILFILEILRKNSTDSEESDIWAYFLQAKLKIEKGLKYNNEEASKSNEEIIPSEEQTTLENLIGLDKIKLELEELKALASLRKRRIELGLPVTPTTLHIVFSGNPGTGKTTVARLLGQIYYDIGILSETKVTEVTRQDLVGEYVGHTAPKTQKIFEKAIGGILFIDEAYSLFKKGNDFGKEAVETLLKLMEDHREKIVVIIAGYPKEIDELLSSNPGLKSRFSKLLNFDDYSKKELLEIYLKMVSDYRNLLTAGAKYKIENLIDTYYDETNAFAANARTIRNIFEDTFKRQSFRLLKIKNPSHEDMITFIDKDIPDSVY